MTRRTINTEKLTPIINDHGGALQELVNYAELSKYFKRVSMNALRLSEIQEDTLYVYGSVSLFDLKVEGKVNVMARTVKAPAVFYLFPKLYSQTGEALQKKELKVIELQVNNALVGYYVSEKNAAIVGDWAHVRSCAIVAGAVWPKFAKELELKTRESWLEAKKRLPYDVDIGCDPEFEIVDESGQIISANAYLKREHISTSSTSRIGVDHAGGPMEIRPKPGAPAEVAEDIEKIFVEFNKIYPTAELSASSSMMSVGGHIHIGFKKNKMAQAVTPPTGLMKLLDMFIGHPLYVTNGDRRRNGSYGSMGDYETKTYGFEYRTPPSTYMQDKTMTTIVFKVAKGIVESYMAQGKLVFETELVEGNEYEVPTKEAYMSIAGLTEDEYNYFTKFIKEWPTKRGDMVLTHWLPAGSVKKVNAVSVAFVDQWYVENRKEMTKMVRELLEELKLDIKVEFFGLASNRGYVNSFEMPTDESHFAFASLNQSSRDALYCFTPGKLRMGVAHSLRNDWGTWVTYNGYLRPAIKQEMVKYDVWRAKQKQEETLLNMLDEDVSPLVPQRVTVSVVA
jgi:hypothetical protein